MTWVNETFAPDVRARCSFIIARFISSSRAGTVRTLVAVGTARLASMLLAMSSDAPRRATAPSSRVVAAALGAGAGLAAASGESGRRSRGALEVAEELAPARCDARGVSQELVVEVLDEPRVGPKCPPDKE